MPGPYSVVQQYTDPQRAMCKNNLGTAKLRIPWRHICFFNLIERFVFVWSEERELKRRRERESEQRISRRKRYDTIRYSIQKKTYLKFISKKWNNENISYNPRLVCLFCLGGARVSLCCPIVLILYYGRECLCECVPASVCCVSVSVSVCVC